MIAVRKAFVWILGAALALSASVWFGSPQKQAAPGLVDAVRRMDLAPPEQSALAAAGLAAALPNNLTPWNIEPARTDPFAPQNSAPPPAAVAAAAPPAVPVPMATPQTPVPPPPTVRFLGTMRTPTGERLAILGDGERGVAAVPGQKLDNDFTVVSVDDTSVLLSHAITGAISVVNLSVPASPPYRQP